MSNFVHLHTHNEYSLLDGFGKAEDWIKVAKELGFTRLALTNHGNIDGNIKFQQECEKEGIKPIHGCEMYIVDDILVKEKGERRYHITLLVKNEKGFKNLLQMLTKANLNGFYYKPRIDPSILIEHCEGLVIMTACAQTFLRMIDIGDILPQLINKTEVFCEIMPIPIEGSLSANELAIQAALDYDLPLVATNDCHYPRASDSELQEVLLCMQTKSKWSNPGRWKFDFDELYLKTGSEMEKSFMKYTDIGLDTVIKAIEYTKEVANLCGFRIESKEPSLPSVYIPDLDGFSEDNQLVQLVMDGLYKRADDHEWIANDIEKYEERIEEELPHIMPNFTRYFLIVWELIHWCEKNDIMVGPGRGSSSGSLVSYCLGITHVDPIKYKLVFSRFISPGRCLTNKSMVISNGIDRKISEIRIGDIVKNKYGNDDIVDATRRFKVNEKLLVINFNGRREICTKDHVWIVQCEDGTISEKRADEISQGKDRLIEIE